MLNFSIIVPCFHDEEKLTCLLAQLQKLPHKPLEIIVVDAANSESCVELCAQFAAKWIASEPCRGQQLLTGAAQAKGDVLWFLHADALLSADPLTAMTKAIEQGATGGYFRFRFASPRSWPVFILERGRACTVAVV